jgi:hypothetical protein
MRGGGTAREGRSCVFTGRRDACRTGGWEMKRTVQNILCAVLVLWMLLYVVRGIISLLP